ncbi:MAG: hypothetical protein ISN26_06755 [Betaproteobacteria bacterium AqS2]|uniref:DUF1579 domain-containing protein n=1 Tax=Candidatus Amphirhobacter heronislandensis TaxID=1732024 RepID=A0A930UIW7_9GAMM|nr:hypothetical protein [Betaproteobacteria bacterium AqS2]
MKRNFSKRALAALAAALFGCAAAQAQTMPAMPRQPAEFITGDWMRLGLWDAVLEQGLLSVDPDDLQSFEPAGVPHQVIQIGPRLAVSNWRSRDFDGEPLEPASLAVTLDGEYVVGAKGYQFDVERRDDVLIVKHWNGTPGCTVSTWWFSYTTDSIDYLGSEYHDRATADRCEP